MLNVLITEFIMDLPESQQYNCYQEACPEP